MKRCSKCQQERPPSSFHVDRSRADGLAYVCRWCRRAPGVGPTKGQRIAMARIGWGWCARCCGWVNPCRGGMCRTHSAEAARQRYASDPTFRAERRQHSHARQRGVDPIPVEAQADIMEAFGARCAYCPAKATSWDHVVAITRGGRTTPGNVVPCCLSCNSRKRNRDSDDWLDEVLARDTLNPAMVDRLVLADAGLYG